MKQYCKYCSNANQIEDTLMYCSIKRITKTKEQASKINKCANFEFNEINLFTDNIYKPKNINMPRLILHQQKWELND